MKKLFTILLFTLLGALAVNATDYYLAGTMNNWSTSANKFTGSSSPYTLDISLDGGTTYEFKLVRKSGSETQWRGKDNGKVTSTSNEIVISGTGGNVSLETTYSGTYKFKYDTQNGNKLTVTYPTPPADLATITVTSADDSQGIVSPAEVKVNATQTATITATPKAGYMIDTWTLGGSAVLAEGNLTDASIKVKSDGTTDPGTAVASFKADPDAIVLYFVNKDNWNPVNIYIWGGSVSMGWPGVTMTKTGDKKMGYDIYSYSVHKGDCNSYKFNCGGDACQSSNFGFDENKRYVYDNQQYASLDDILAHTIIIDGSSYGYDKFQLKNSTDDDTYTGSINITGSQYQFKIKADSETRSDETTYTDSFVDKKMSKDQGRTTLTTTVAGEYQFKYVVSTKLLSVTYPAPPADPATITVTSADDSQGSVSPAEVQVNETQSAIITATPKAGYMFDTWTLSGSAVLAEGNLTDSSIKVKSDGTTDPGTAVASFEVDPNVVTLYFVNSIEWSKVNAYLYNAKIKDWPGLEMTKTSMTATSYNYEVWSISFDKNNHTNIIFNNGDGKQTPASMELWNAEKPYYDYNNNAWYASLDDIVPVVPQAHKVFVRGGFNGWDDSFQLKSATGDGVFEGTISWNKNQTYNFKLTVDDAWKSVDKTINETGAFEIPNDGGDMKVATNEYEGDFKFSYDYSSKILTVTYPTDEKVTILVSSDDTDKGTVDKESVEVGKYSTATITALPESGYKLSMWTLTNAVLASGSLTDAAITIKSDGSGLDGTAVASFVEDPDAVVVKYLNTNNWEPVYIHMWGAKETQWHGLPMKNTGEQKYGYDVYSITINKNDYKSCIFNDNGDNKSRNLVFGKDDAQYEPDYSKLVCSQGKWYASLEDVPEPTFQTFYYVNRYNWEMPKIYFYGGDGYGSFTSYPGVDMLKQDGVSVNGCDVYYYNVEEGLFQSYIIGQGTDEDKYEATIDPENLVYYYKGVRFNKLEDIKPLTLVGEFNEWDASANKLEMEDNIGFTSVVLSANKTYKFKILDNGIYLSNSGTMTSDNCTGWTMETDKGDCNIETKNKGEFTFSFDVKTSKLSVTYPEMVTGF
ncbi:MAG: starch-binding protein, partial [Paludibacteraceae bacterium]|nr:starch-binding protein [Paludibacteraceae bacterium]